MSLKDKRNAARSGKMNCPICNKNILLIEHHSFGRDHPDCHKAWNRCYICPGCHDDIHSGIRIVEGYVQTSEGMKLIWRFRDEDPIVNQGAQTYLYSNKK